MFDWVLNNEKRYFFCLFICVYEQNVGKQCMLDPGILSPEAIILDILRNNSPEIFDNSLGNICDEVQVLNKNTSPLECLYGNFLNTFRAFFPVKIMAEASIFGKVF